MPTRSAVRAAVLTCAALGAGLAPGVAAADPGDTRTVTVCTEAALRAAIGDAPDGGTVQIACDGPIVVTPEGGSTIVVDKTLLISGTGHDVVVDGGYRTSLFAVQAPAGATSPTDLPTVTLRDLTLTRGWSQDTGYTGGGAVWSAGHLVVERVAFTDNHAFDRGGAILGVGSGSTTVVASSFTGNTVTCPLDGSGGGAIAVRQWNPTTITGSTFTGNAATGFASGGAVLAWVSSGFNGFPVEPPTTPAPASPFSAPLVITDSTFTDNALTVSGLGDLDRMYGGGAVASFDHPLTVTGSVFERNTVEGIIVHGGAVLAASIRDTPTTMTAVEVLGNGFPDRVAGLPANGIGGGLALHGTPARIEDAIVEGNRAFVGGGLYTRGGPVELVDSTVEANTAGAVDAGSGNFGAAVATRGPLVVRGTRMAGNAKGTCLVLRDPAAAPPAWDPVADAGGNEVDGAASCFRVSLPPTPPAPTGPLGAPAAPTAPGDPVALTGDGFAPHARVTLAAYPLHAAAAVTGTSAAAPAPVDLGEAAADGSGSLTTSPVLPGAGVWQVLALGSSPSGTPVALSTVVLVAAPGVDVAPVVTAQPSSAGGAVGTTVTLTAAAVGVPVPTVRWQRPDDGGTTWTDVPGATATTLTVPVTAGTVSYRAVFTNVAGTTVSEVAAVSGPAGTPGGPGGPGGPGAGGGAGTGTVGDGGAVPAVTRGVATPGPVTAPGGLAQTGADVLPLAGAGGVLLLVGTGLVLCARRRRAPSGVR
ncbi:hypothetical protein [Trujillonella humicola]|uniref:hypothetical protein n=1 Tax=Trujillonella humicola TaxID=3383699 RepID=UPI0039065B80